MTSVLDAWHAATPDPIGPWDDYWALHQAGVPWNSIQCGGLLGVGADDIAFQNGRWERRFMGRRAIIVPAMGFRENRLSDLVAFRLDAPRAFWRLEGTEPLLGYDSLEDASDRREPLMVHESPLDWLRAGRIGAVILDWTQYWPMWFSHIPALRVMDVAFGRRLKAMLERPLQIPEIQVATT